MTMTLVETIIRNLEGRKGFDAAFDIDDDVLAELKQEMADAIDARLMSQESEIDRLLKRVEFTQQWYAERFERLRDLGKERGCWSEMATVIANGSLSGLRDPNGNISYEPPTYAQQMNMLRHRANLAESRLAAANALLRECEELAADPELKGDLFYRIQTHLQGAGYEGGRPA